MSAEYWWRIAQPNGDACWGYGTEREALRLAELWSVGEGVHCWHAVALDPDCDAEMIARLEAGNDGFDLAEELAELAADSEGVSR